MQHYFPKILITGSDGQIARAFIKKAQAKNLNFVACNKNSLDITELASIEKNINQHQPDIVLNTAAFTAVDKAEQEQSTAQLINVHGMQNLSTLCQKHQIRLLHLSTDYVFDGQQKMAYQENDTPQPINYYGYTKLASETILQANCRDFLILRISAVFSFYGVNFVKTILRLLNSKPTLNIVADQYTCPTSADDIADALITLTNQTSMPGIYHYASEKVVSWYQFASAIVTEFEKYRNLATKLQPIKSENYPTLAKRPLFSVLDCKKIRSAFGIHQPCWQTALTTLIPKLIENHD